MLPNSRLKSHFGETELLFDAISRSHSLVTFNHISYQSRLHLCQLPLCRHACNVKANRGHSRGIRQSRACVSWCQSPDSVKGLPKWGTAANASSGLEPKGLHSCPCPSEWHVSSDAGRLPLLCQLVSRMHIFPSASQLCFPRGSGIAWHLPFHLPTVLGICQFSSLCQIRVTSLRCLAAGRQALGAHPEERRGCLWQVDNSRRPWLVVTFLSICPVPRGQLSSHQAIRG